MLRVALITILLTGASPVLAEPLLYRLVDADNTIWLLGSVHALTANDYPLDARIESAYADAERVVLEVSPDELNPAHIAQVALPLARYQDGQRLADAFNDVEYAKLRGYLEARGLDARQFSNFEPWFVGLQVFALNLAQSDYASAQGVDKHFAARALSDGKQTGGLETAAEQFRMFDTLPLETQKSFLLESMNDSANFEQQLDEIVSAWRRGDEAALAGLLETEFSAAPDLRDTLLVDRNQRWIPQIETLLESTGDSLVIVGALHLVGDEGVVSLLEEKGYDVEKL
ncbi:MAG TPA: TraB/GumN family protein [Gammaproteobacteria bacterium]